MGFEPTRAKPNRFLIYRLNHSAIVSSKLYIYIYINAGWMAERSKAIGSSPILLGGVGSNPTSTKIYTKKNFCIIYVYVYIYILFLYDIASRGFDPRTFGLWAQRASAAPTRFDYIYMYIYIYIQKYIYIIYIYIFKTSAAGFEPTRENPTRFQVWRLNHSAILTILFIYIFVWKCRVSIPVPHRC